MRKISPDNFSMAYGTSSFSTKSNMSDFIAGNPPFDAENITRNGGKVNAKVITGRPTRSYLNDNDMLALQYAVTEANNLVSSHNADFTLNPEFPAELQPRDRTRDTMKGQISSISNTLNPDRLGGSLNASVGAPIVGRDLVVESGNGRTMAIKQRYNKDGATEYKAWIIQNAGKFGFNPEKLAEIQQPVLVRIRLSGGDRKSITERANEADIASMSPMEQAKVDDSRLTAADMESFTPSKEGDIAAASNAGFIAKFIEKVGKAEAAGLLTADSRPTKALVDRIQCAIFSKAYADDRLLTLMAEETHPAVKNILTALTAAAPVFAKIRASYPDMGGIKLVDNIIEATRLMVQARDGDDGIEMILSQMGLFSQIPDETKTITRILNDNIRRSKHLGTVFKLAGERILSFLQNQNQVGLFGKEPPPTASEVITGAIARAAEIDPANRQKGIFEDIGSTIGNLYDDSLSLKNNNEKRIVYRKVTQDEAEKIKKETGHDISGYKRIISNYGIRHIDNRHGKDKGDMAIKKADILLI
jgi:ddrB-like ParB superfamily domain